MNIFEVTDLQLLADIVESQGLNSDTEWEFDYDEYIAMMDKNAE